MEASILNKKLELIQWLSSLEDGDIIEELIDFRNKASKDWWNEISEVEQLSIEKGIVDAENKNLKPHSSVRKLYEKWL